MNMNMKKYIIAAALLIGVSSCNFLDIEPLDSYTENNIFSDPVLTEAYVTKNYTLPRNGWGQAALRFVCDESMNNFSWWDSWVINQGGMTPDQMGGLSSWDDYYWNIKNCNIFFNNIDKLDSFSDDEKNLLIGEMTFFRAFYYMDLVNKYGGVPLITRTFELEDPNMMIPRNSYEECVKFIVDEMGAAANLLPTSHSGKNFGRVTKGAALAMKARMLLYAASPLWNTTNDLAKWDAAAKACEAVLDLNMYSLDNNYKGLFLNPNSSEIIFQRLYTSEFGHWYDWQNTPNGWSGYSATCVLQEMVDSYELENGMLPDSSVIYKNATSDPWVGRDPRFYASIVCDGQNFRNGVVDFWVNEDGKTGGSDSEFGVDAWNYSKSHYTIRKFMNESLTGIWRDKGNQPWIYCRLAEVYLNYAEAMFQLGKEDVAREYVNKIRFRARGGKAGILPDVTESGDALLERIQRERKVELAFEEHRFFDVRRWKIADKTENGDVHGINITLMKNGDKKYKIFPLQKREFKSQHYLLPIPQTERNKNSLLDQNPGYSK